MWFINVMQSAAGRTAKVLFGLWLFAEGAALVSLGGLVMMMVGVVLIVTALARICLVEEAIKAWRTRHGQTPRPRAGHA
jgi:multidrug transporter EmrE-like cation transporter